MQAGTARIDITPCLGTHLAGYGSGKHRPAETVRDPLYANVLLLETGGRKACVVSLDLICVTEEYTRRIRERAAAEHGVDPAAVIVHTVQNHSAPSLGGLLLDADFPLEPTPETGYITGAETEYCEFAMERIARAVTEAGRHMTPVQLGWGRAVRSGLAYNRRGVLRNGGICMPWLFSSRDKPVGPTEILHLEGPDDPEVGVAGLRRADGRMCALFLSFACHPVNLFVTDPSAISGEWPGAWAAGMRRQLGEQCLPVVLNGCCGNLNPWPPFVADFKPDPEHMGKALSEASEAVLEGMTFSDTDALEWRMRKVPLAYRDIPPERMAEVDRILAASPQPVWDAAHAQVEDAWFCAASAKSIDYCRRRMPEHLYEVQVLRVGEAAIVALPGEPFVEGQLRIKLRSPAPFTCVAHMCTNYAGYLPTAEAWSRGGHEAHPDARFWAKLEQNALDIVVRNVREMISELF